MPCLQKIVVKDFRNIAFQEVAFSQKVNCLVGDNGEGKTNLLDAIHHLCMTKGAFPAPDRDNWRYGTEGFSIGGRFAMENGMESQFSLQADETGKRLVRDGKPQPRLGAHIGTLPVVMVSPADSLLVGGPGQERRRLANMVLSQSDPAYLAAIQKLSRLMERRNKLLKGHEVDEDLLAVLDAQLSEPAATVHAARQTLCAALRPVVARYYGMLSGGGETVDIGYHSDLSEGVPLAELLSRRRAQDLALHYTGAGPQRDDFAFSLDGHPLRFAGSQGQRKSFLVALKFAQYEVMRKACGVSPLLLLDDVFDKLDLGRTSRLISLVAGSGFGQIFLTDTDPARVRGMVEGVTKERAYFHAEAGTFTRVEA